MRIRKRAWTETVLNKAQERKLYTTQPEKLKGLWKDVLKVETLHVEIGAGKGDYYLGMSHLYPQEGWVSIEKEETVAAYALRKVLDDPTTNGLFVIADANNIGGWFDSEEVDKIHLNFSDPWPKKAHHKRRLTSSSFLDDYHRILSQKGEIILKSDNKGFFEDSLLIITNHKFTLVDFWVDFRREDHPEDVITEYEQRFIDLNQPIYRAIWRKNNDQQISRIT